MRRRSLPFDACRLQETLRSTSVVMVNSVPVSFCKVQIQLVNIRMDQWIWHHFLLEQLEIRPSIILLCFPKQKCMIVGKCQVKLQNAIFTVEVHINLLT